MVGGVRTPSAPTPGRTVIQTFLTARPPAGMQ